MCVLTRYYMIATISLTLGGCDGGTELEFIEADASWDSIVAPSWILVSDSLVFDVYGWLPDPCWSLDRLEVNREPTRLRLRAVMKRTTRRDVACPPVIVSWTRRVVEAPPFRVGLFDLLAERDETSEVLAQVEIR